MAEAKKTIKKVTVKKPAAKTVVKKSSVKQNLEVKKPAAKKVAKAAVVSSSSEPKRVEKQDSSRLARTVKSESISLTVDVFDITGKVAGKVTLPEEVFGVKINKKLVAQAVRVYLVNQRRGSASTLTRGEVDGSTRKIYRQKGTGRARHGGIRAPIFVKGGIAHGPKPKDYALSLPKKMKVAAFASAMTAKLQSGEIKVVSGLESLETKTKKFADVFEKLGFSSKKRNMVVVMPKDMKDTYKGMRNLQGVSVTTADRLNTYEVLKYKAVVLMKDAVDVLAGTHKEK